MVEPPSAEEFKEAEIDLKVDDEKNSNKGDSSIKGEFNLTSSDKNHQDAEKEDTSPKKELKL